MVIPEMGTLEIFEIYTSIWEKNEKRTGKGIT